MLNEISKIFQNGIQDLIKDKGPREKDPYIFLLFNCPEHFFKKYCDKDFNIIDFKGLNLITNLFVSCDPMLQLDEEISKRTLDELSKMEDNKIEEEISIRNNYSNIIEGLLNHVFEHFENAPEDLLSDLLAKIREERMIKMRNEFPSEYEKINKIFEKILEMENKEMENYSYLEYDDFVLIFARILKYFTGLDIQLTFTDLPNSFALSIYGNEKQIDKLAEKKEYELQLKNYGYKYQKILEEANKKSPGLYSNEILTGNEIGDDNRQLLSNSNDNNLNTYGNEWIPLKYSDLREKNVLCFAPTEKYKSEKEEKFQRYFGGDEYHECNVTYDGDEICECGCSKYRGIDKLRLIYDSIDTLVKMNYLRQENILNYILIKRNYIDYGDKLSIKNIVFKSWNIFNTGTQMDYIFTIRNFYNEEIAYYFLWITSLVKWLIIPAILGIIVNYSNKIMINPDGSHNHTILLLLSAFLALWGTAFLNYWDQKEKIFNYIWGTESFQRSEPDSEAFVPDGFVTLVFNRQFPYVSATKTICKQLVSYIVLFLMLTAIVIGVYIIFMLKVILIKKYPEQQTYIGILSALENTVLIAIMSSLYSMIKLNDWQNYRKDFQRMNALAVKFILYDLINNFYPLFYIAFIKKATIFGKEAEQCYGFGGNDSCLEEIEIQLYTTLSVNFGLNFLEIGLPIFHQGARMIALKKKLEIKGIKIGQSNEDNISALSPHSIDHQMILDEYTEMISEYSEILVDLGYLLLFGVVAPLVPFLVLLLVYTEKFFDSYKIFFLSRVKLLDQSNGLNIYNTVFRLIVYGGMFSNVAFLIFGDNYFMPTKNISYKVVLYCAVEFVIFILTLFVKWNIMPSWFEYLDDIKEVYNKKYFRRSAKNLPHLLLLERQKKHKLRSSQIKIKTE